MSSEGEQGAGRGDKDHKMCMFKLAVVDSFSLDLVGLVIQTMRCQQVALAQVACLLVSN
jgi:hypothetical protein